MEKPTIKSAMANALYAEILIVWADGGFTSDDAMNDALQSIWDMYQIEFVGF
jgi:hypothetical protein